MVDLKLPKLPDRTPVKLTISLSPDLHRALNQYATLYGQAYGSEEPIVELIPAMLSEFLAGDRAFQKERGGRKSG